MIKFHEQFDYVLAEVLNVSANSVAKTIGAHQGLVNRYRKGLTAPPVEFAQKFCEHYGISANWLLLNIEPILMADIDPNKKTNQFAEELRKRNQLKSDLLSLKKTIGEICENNL